MEQRKIQETHIINTLRRLGFAIIILFLLYEDSRSIVCGIVIVSDMTGMFGYIALFNDNV
jgi:hypothetical protein